MLGKVSKLDQKALVAWNAIPKKAADMWIEMGTQRCRLVVVIPNGALTSQAARAKKAREDGLELIIKPELRRYGDSKGQDLSKMETMVKSEGSVVRG
jgi:hypothetical protein